MCFRLMGLFLVSMKGWAGWLSSQEPGLQGVLPYHDLPLRNPEVNTEASSLSCSSWRYKVKLYKKLRQMEHTQHVRTGPLVEFCWGGSQFRDASFQ